jgi:hypothetical protein
MSTPREPGAAPAGAAPGSIDLSAPRGPEMRLNASGTTEGFAAPGRI